MKWSVRPCPQGWGIYDTTGQFHDTEETFSEALKLAQQYALSERIFQPDGLEWFAKKTGTWRVQPRNNENSSEGDVDWLRDPTDPRVHARRRYRLTCGFIAA